MQEALEWVSKCNSGVNLMVVFCCLDQRHVFENLRWWDVITALLAKLAKHHNREQGLIVI